VTTVAFRVKGLPPYPYDYINISHVDMYMYTVVEKHRFSAGSPSYTGVAADGGEMRGRGHPRSQQATTGHLSPTDLALNSPI